jgi:hypothetical protein
MNKKKNNVKAKKGNKGSKSLNLSPTATSYTGPLRSLKEREEINTVTTVIGFDTVLASTAGGVVNSVFDNSASSLGNTAEWATLIQSWAEYRVLLMHFEYFPVNRYSKVTTVTYPGILVVDRVSNAALSSIIDGMNHSSSKVLSLEDPTTISISMNGTDEAAWRPTNGSAYAFIKFYASSLTVSTNYGIVYIWYRVQFRGKTN